MEMPNFELEDSAAWLQHLHVHGVVRIRSVLNAEEVRTAKSLFWDWLESLGGGAKRDDSATWTDDNFPGLLEKGFFCTRGGGQSSAAWAIRSNRRVHQAFSKIWGTDDLLTSLDTFIGWRPWWATASGGAAPRPKTEGMHCDQNPHTKHGLKCVQGMVPLRPVCPSVGGLCVAPGTHSDAIQAHLRELFPATKSDDWLPIELKYPKDELNLCGELVVAEPGDLILWDSRALHGGYVGAGRKIATGNPELARLSMTVCMVPASEASEEVLKKRAIAIEKGHTTTHWPLEVKKQAGKDSAGKGLLPLPLWQEQFRPFKPDAWAQSLVCGRSSLEWQCK
jgi:hypothetical protein